ncbi:MAG: asparagine synthase (glutamine-hydrolyzing) [Planctomycetaceae bacterium]|nr:asparagine synthase (glutamine-hydrolyzing) [Planctomycetaceae bacterium]
MCGITGAVWTSAASAIEPEVLARMTDVLTHRGPDGRGVYTSCVQQLSPATGSVRVALGHRRLSIIDRVGGAQPLANEDETVWIVFNGEIYNFQELRHRLEGAGHTFRGHSDTEVLVHLYEDEGLDFLRHLNGMFALAIWDEKRRQLVLARDRLGKKPLIYRREPDRLLFASELKSLLQVPGLPRDIDPAALDSYLTYQYVPHPQMIFRGYHKLPPAHYAVWRDGQLQVGCYWQPDFRREVARPRREYLAELQELLTSAVELRLQSDVPLGAFLSGGIDSSIVVALMQKLRREPVKTFSIGFPVAEYDETHYAREVARHIGTDHHEFQVEPDGVEVLDRLVWYYDEPFADSSAIPTYYVSQLTRAQVTVALTGDGGDELFAGYARYRAAQIGGWFDRLPSAVRNVIAAEVWQKIPNNPERRTLLRRYKRLIGALRQSPERRYLEWVGIFGEASRAELYHEDFLSRLDRDPGEFLFAAFARAQGRDAVTRASLADLVTYLPCDLLTKVDIASMAHGLECRQPFLDYRVVELAAAMPIELKLRGARGKRILIEAFGELLPPAILRRRKMGFGVPLEHWFRRELRAFTRDVLLSSRCLDRGYFRPAAVTRLVDEHQAGRFDHSAKLWALLVLELWQREWVDR